MGSTVRMGLTRARLFESAIQEHRHIRPMAEIGILLIKGAEGVEKNVGRAVQLYECAIGKGDGSNAM